MMKFVPFTRETLAPSIRLRYGLREIYPFIAAYVGILEILIRSDCGAKFYRRASRLDFTTVVGIKILLPRKRNLSLI